MEIKHQAGSGGQKPDGGRGKKEGAAQGRGGGRQSFVEAWEEPESISRVGGGGDEIGEKTSLIY